MPNMTFGQARDVMRRHFDMWQASGFLHEALAKADEAERYMGRVQAEIPQAEAKVQALTEQIHSLEQSHQEKENSLIRQYEDRRAGLESSYQARRHSYETDLADWKAKVDAEALKVPQMERAYSDRLSALKADESTLHARVEALRAELQALRERLAGLV
jgi:chromosome segregation ATPase